jgi:hypothetical protein
MRRGKSELGFVVLLAVSSFLVLSWSVGNPRQAKKFKDECVQVASEVISLVCDLLPDKSDG